MKISIGINFDDEEKLLFKAVPDAVLKDVVKFASNKGYEIIEEEILSFARAILEFKNIGSKGGDYN